MADANTADILYIGYNIAIIPSIGILLVLTALQRRLTPNKCGQYRPGLVVPVRFLDGYTDRWSYALCFGAIVGIILNVVFDATNATGTGSATANDTSDASTTSSTFCDNSDSSACNETYVKTLLLQVRSVVASLVCAPHFVCIATPHKLVGAIMGFFYALLWFVFYLVNGIESERYYDSKLGTLLVIQDLPIMACLLGLCVRAVRAVYLCYTTKQISVQYVDTVVEPHQSNHVTSLFRQPPDEEPPAPDKMSDKLKAKVKSEIFPHFKLPTRIICIACAQGLIIYYITVAVIGLWLQLRRLLKQLNDTSSVLTAATAIHIFDGVYLTSAALGFLSSVIYIALFVYNYRINMINIYKGKKNVYVEQLQSSCKHVTQSLRLPGYQIAYITYGFFVIFTVTLLIFSIICYGIYFLDQIGWLKPAFYWLLQTLSVPLSTIAIFYLQILLVRLFLLQPKINKGDKGTPLNVNNRHLYEVVSYLLLFSNLAVGFASALMRTGKSFVLGVVLMGRLDRCLLMRGFETMDPGYMAYVGTLLVDNAHNNPVMRVFCGVLLRLTHTPHDKEALGIRFLREPQITGSNSRAARRWHLAYTLIHNPDLLPRRKLALLLTRGLEADDSLVTSGSRPPGSRSRTGSSRPSTRNMYKPTPLFSREASRDKVSTPTNSTSPTSPSKPTSPSTKTSPTSPSVEQRGFNFGRLENVSVDVPDVSVLNGAWAVDRKSSGEDEFVDSTNRSVNPMHFESLEQSPRSKHKSYV